MRDLYSDDDPIADAIPDRLIPEGARRLAGAVVFIGLIGAMGLWSYRLGTRDAGEVPVIKAMAGPNGVQPEDPGGLQAEHQGLEVNTVLAGRPAPVPHEILPAKPPPDVLAREDGPQGELVLPPPAPMPEPVPDADLTGPDGGPEALAAAAPPAAAAPDIAALVESVVAPEASSENLRPRLRPVNLTLARAKLPAAETPAAAPAAREISGLPVGTRLVQLGAFDSEELTRSAWSHLVSRQGDLLAGKSLYIERTTANVRVFYRLRVAGFDNAEETRAMCEALKARNIDCIPVTLQ